MWDEVLWTGLMWLRIGPLAGSYEHDNEPLGFITCWDVLEWLHNWELLKKGSDPSSYLRFLKKRSIVRNALGSTLCRAWNSLALQLSFESFDDVLYN
jgi:hypothetical protein